ncbi:SDR family NAD(P)-dependent oxidoreductase [Nocardia sp. NPDC050435]|uniref:SDR family NAD(P)-dependent oxidoreductase n=1 Tax=Nocardia sp. NPDC050435 TaxID=3155040 RepID=UPI0033DA01BB
MYSNPTHLRDWLIERVASYCGIPAAEVDPGLPFAALGLDSSAVTELAANLSGHLGRAVHPAILFEHPTVTGLVARLVSNPSLVPVRTTRAPQADAIAIVGMSARVPGAPSLDAFWQLLCDGTDPITMVGRDGWSRDGLSAGELGACFAGLMSDVDRFDAGFFGIPDEEARRMDPQHRLLLQGVWEAFEDGGIVPDRLRGTSTGVYVGISSNEYGRRQVGVVENAHALTPTGNALSLAANRVSYLFDLRGPSVAVDTACSSSIVALHLAVRALRTGECETAVVAGVNLVLEQDISMALARAGMLAPDGRCRSFDAEAKGYVRAEGCLSVVLKPLAAAEAAGDRIYAVVKGTAVNQDGRSNGLTAPNPAAQQAVLAAAYADSGVTPSEVHYVECHGTGTLLGDPIETRSLGSVVGVGRERPCLIGSVKSNIGHLEAAAGLAGLVKVALALRHGYIPATLHYQKVNPHIDLRKLGLQVAAAGLKWPDGGFTRLAGVSSFGFGGTNAHVVLAGAPATDQEIRATTGPVLVPVSARDPQALMDAASALSDRLARAADLSAVAATAALRRSHHPHRLAAVGASAREIIGVFRDAVPASVRISDDAPLVFAFSGQSAFAYDDLRILAEADDRVGATLRRCDEVMADIAGWHLLDLLRNPEDPALNRPDVAQPVAVAAQLALAAMWGGLGVRPHAVIGHSLGEVSAAVVAGALTFAQGLHVAFERGRAVQQSLGTGKMLALAVSETEALGLVTKYANRIALAAVNSPQAVVLSGAAEALAEIGHEHESAGGIARWIPVDYPSHSPWMAGASGDLRSALAHLQAAPARIPFFSTVTGTGYDSVLDAGYWADNLRQPVRFARAAAQLLEAGAAAFVELGPHPTLRTPLRQLDSPPPLFVSTMERGTEPWRHVLEGLATLYEAGVDPRWDRVAQPAPRTDLPTYPWRRNSYWIPRSTARRMAGHPLLGAKLDLAMGGDVWELVVADEPPAVTAGHVIDGNVIMPAAGFVEMMLAAGRELGIAGVLEARDIRFHAFLSLSGGPLRVQTVADLEGSGYAIRVLAKPVEGEKWRLHATATVVAAAAGEVAEPDLSAAQPVATGDIYAAFEAAGVTYGSDYRMLRDIRVSGRTAAATLTGSGAEAGLVLDPRLLDAAFQLSLPAAGLGTGARLVPERIGSVVLAAVASPSKAWATVTGDTADVALVSATGRPVAIVRGIEAAAPRITHRPRSFRYEPVWRAQPRSGPDESFADGIWLVAAHTAQAAEAVSERLRAEGAAVHAVVTGDRYSYQAAGVSMVDFRLRAQWSRLLNEPGAFAADTLNVVYLAKDMDRFDPHAALEIVQSSAALVQALSVKTLAHRRWWIVTRGCHAVSPDELVVGAAGAGVWGLARVLPFELPLVQTRCVDLPSAAHPADGVDELLDELSRPSTESEVALRAGRRYVARFVVAAEATADAGILIRADAAYLIAGGLGALGLRVARWLSEQGARHIGVIGRQTPSPSAAGVLAGLSATVHVFSGDVGDLGFVENAVARMRAHAPLGGVVSAAGVLRDGPLLEMSADALAAVMWPKVMGAACLDAATEGDELDWFVHFSSAAALLGSPGQAAYCAANALADSFGAWQRSRGRNAVVINWGPWGAAGLAVDAVRDGNRMAAAYTALEPADGIRALGQLLGERRPQTLVMPTNLRNLVQYFPSALGIDRFAEITAGNEALLRGTGLGVQRSGRPSLKQAYVAPRTDLERRIADIWQNSLGFERVGVHDGFFELGGDSVFANQLVLEVNRVLRVSLDPAAAFENLTVAHLAGLAEQDMLRQLAGLTDEQAEALLREGE